MEDWTFGYRTDIGYTYGYYNELNPLRMKLAFLHAGVQFPEVKTACELGYGQGVSLNIHAAASTITWHGTDFNPTQANFAQKLARCSGADLTLRDDSFEEFFKRDDLPDFDFICLHGIWSWVTDINKQAIVDFLKKKLKVGGVLYISYNTLPGWATVAPLRHLLTTHGERMAMKGSGGLAQVENSLIFADSLLATKPQYAQSSPAIKSRLETLKIQDRTYLLHEYFNKAWEPMHFTTVVDWLSQAKLDFVCSAHYPDHIPLLNFTDAQQEFLKSIPDNLLKETVRDFMVNQQFRRDYWVRGAYKISLLEQSELLRAQKIMLIAPNEKISLKIQCVQGEASMAENIYRPLLKTLADHTVKSIHDLELACPDIAFNQIIEAVILLAGFGHIVAVQEDTDSPRIKAQVQALNISLIEKARGDDDVHFLASPVSGGGITVGRFEKLFLLALSLGKKTPEGLAAYAWKILSTQNQLLIKDGVTLQTPEENTEALRQQADVFLQEKLPLMKSLELFGDHPILGAVSK